MLALPELKKIVRRRFEFIEFQLNWEGSIGRKKLQDQFAISPQQATNDLTSYMDLCPDNMIYDSRQKTYVPSRSFKPRLTHGDAAEYFMHLEMLHGSYRDENEIWISSIPSFDAISAESRQIRPSILKAIVRAIQSGSSLAADYTSMTSGGSDQRVLSPHAIASDGHRWHMRAYDYDKSRHSDFVLSRLKRVSIVDRPHSEPPEDEAWNTLIDVVFAADPKLDKVKRLSIEHEYGMEDGRFIVTVRQAMLFYYLRHYGFDPRASDKGRIRNSSSFLLSIKNLKEVDECLGRRK